MNLGFKHPVMIQRLKQPQMMTIRVLKLGVSAPKAINGEIFFLIIKLMHFLKIQKTKKIQEENGLA